MNARHMGLGMGLAGVLVATVAIHLAFTVWHEAVHRNVFGRPGLDTAFKDGQIDSTERKPRDRACVPAREDDANTRIRPRSVLTAVSAGMTLNACASP